MKILLTVLTLMGIVTSVSLTSLAANKDQYPKEWWQEFPTEGAPSWEILPQQAGPGEVILSKRTELGILSNFAATPFTYHSKKYASLEGFWQAMKFPEDEKDPRAVYPGLEWKYSREQVNQLVGFEAKAAGDLGSVNMKAMKIDWVTFEKKQMVYKPKEPGDHYKIIVEAMWEKVKQNPEVEKILLKTGDLILKPDHKQEADAPKAWKYHEIYMQIRKELQNKKKRT